MEKIGSRLDELRLGIGHIGADSELEVRVKRTPGPPPPTDPTAPRVIGFVETEYWVLVRRDVEVQAEPGKIGGTPGKIG